jgi:hypothetical protein
VHNHVVRDAVNDPWGESCSVTEGEVKTFTYNHPINASWKAEHLSVVAFVYNDDGVVQVERESLKIEN